VSDGGGAGATVLCSLDAIPVPGSKGFTLGRGETTREIFVVRDANGLRAYANACPHTGGPLDWTPDRFLTRDGKTILCATHGALFRIDDGYCLRGPCAGKSLTPVPVAVRGDDIVLIGDDNGGLPR